MLVPMLRGLRIDAHAADRILDGRDSRIAYMAM